MATVPLLAQRHQSREEVCVPDLSQIFLFYLFFYIYISAQSIAFAYYYYNCVVSTSATSKFGTGELVSKHYVDAEIKKMEERLRAEFQKKLREEIQNAKAEILQMVLSSGGESPAESDDNMLVSSFSPDSLRRSSNKQVLTRVEKKEMEKMEKDKKKEEKIKKKEEKQKEKDSKAVRRKSLKVSLGKVEKIEGVAKPYHEI